MKAILSSAGITTPELAQTLSRLVGKPLNQINVAVINEASAVEPGDKRWFFNEMQRLSTTVGGEIDVVNLLALDMPTIKQRITFADVVYVVGGVTDYLLTVFQRTGFSDLLKNELLKDKVYVGASAGSMVVVRRINTDGYERVYRKGDQDFGVIEYMALVDLAIFPHLNSANWTRNKPDVIQQATKDFDYSVYAITDTQAVVIDGDDLSFVGGEALTVGGHAGAKGNGNE